MNYKYLVVILIQILPISYSLKICRTNVNLFYTKHYSNPNKTSFDGQKSPILKYGPILPILYQLNISINTKDNQIFQNSIVSIKLKKLRQAKVFALHSKQLKIQQISLKIEERVFNADKYCFDEYNDLLIIKSSIISDYMSIFEVIIHYSSKINSQLNGIYHSSYSDTSSNQHKIISTHFEPSHARAAFPCFDEPSIKAIFKINLEHDSTYIANSNMPIKNKITNGNRTFTEFEETPLMSTYLVAFVLHDYTFISIQKDERIMINVYLPEHQIELGYFALNVSHNAIKLLENLFNISYVLPKIDLFGIPEFEAGAMENWGLITFRMTSILVNETSSSDLSKQWVAQTVSHELSHQWFGNLVTMEWWNDLWLNEGFACFMEYLIVDKLYPHFKMMQQFISHQKNSAMSHDQLRSTHSVSVAISKPNEIEELFDHISYGKGASILLMIFEYVGEENFFKSLGIYLKKYSYQNTITQDLWDTFSQVKVMDANINVEEFIEPWISQTGYPVINVNFDKSRNTTFFRQSRFFLMQKLQKDNQLWPIPVKNHKNQLHWHKSKYSQVKTDNFSFSKINPNGAWYYRTNYKSNIWNEFLNNIISNSTCLTLLDKFNLLTDAFHLTRAGMLKISFTLKLLFEMLRQDDFLLWSESFNNLMYIWKRTFINPYTEFLFKEVLQKFIIKKFESITWKDSYDYNQRLIDAAIISSGVSLDNVEVLKKSLEIYDQWLKKTNKISPNILPDVLCATVKQSNQTVFDQILGFYFNETDNNQQENYLFAMSCTTSLININKFFNWIIDKNSPINTADSVILWNYIIAVRQSNINLAWNFFTNHWDEFYERFRISSSLFSTLIRSIVSRFDDHKHYMEIKNFFKNKNIPARALTESLEQVESNLFFLKKHMADIRKWLNSNIDY